MYHLLKHVYLPRQDCLETRPRHQKGSKEYPRRCHVSLYSLSSRKRTYHPPTSGSLLSERQTPSGDPTALASVEQLLL